MDIRINDGLEDQILGAPTSRYDYELHRHGAGTDVWDIIAIDHQRNGREVLVATLPSEEQAKVAWEQVMACAFADRGVMYRYSQTPAWEIKWFDEADFCIESLFTKEQGLKNQTVMTLAEEGVPHRVRVTPIEHWGENPLLAETPEA